MNVRKVRLRDEPADYTIYYPFPCYQLPLIGQDIPDTGCQCVSIDPAINNFALRIEKRYRTGYIETIYMVKVDFSQYGDVSETQGTTHVNPQILEAATSLILNLSIAMQETRIVAIERQMAINYKSSRIFQHLLTLFRMIVPNFRNYCIITDVSPKLKGRILGAPKGLNKAGLKEWAVEKAIEILTWRNDQSALAIIRQHRGKAKTKADDLSDTVVQIEALFILLRGVFTQPPQALYIGPQPQTSVVAVPQTLAGWINPSQMSQPPVLQILQ